MQREHSGEVIAFWGSTKAETRMLHRNFATVLDVEKTPVARDPLTLEKSLQAESDEKLYQEQSESVGDPQSCFRYDRYKILVRKAKLDRALHRVVPERLRHQ